MEKLEETQVCTSVEQSERLLKLGIKKETADMLYVTDNNVEKKYRYHRVKVGCYIPAVDDGLHYIPAWSLHRLLMLKDVGGLIGTGVYINDMNVAKCYEVVISRIEELLRNDAFDHDYLEENEVD